MKTQLEKIHSLLLRSQYAAALHELEQLINAGEMTKLTQPTSGHCEEKCTKEKTK